MSNRWLRFVIAVLALSAAAAAGYKVFQHEQRFQTEATASRAAETAAQSALTTISEIKAALHAYVAPGQGQPFWTSRSAQLLNQLRSAVLELDKIATAAGAPLTEALDLVDRLGASEQRAKEYVRVGQALLAGDVVFTESRDLLDGVRLLVARARDQIAQSAVARDAEIRREQTMLLAGGAAILALAVLILVPPPAPPDTVPISITSATVPPLDDSVEGIVRRATPVPKAAEPEAPISSAPSTATPAEAPAELEAGPVALEEAAAVCTDLARVADAADVSALMARATDVLKASGIIVWMASDDRQQLYPAASAGYDERLFARVGSIPRDATNLTASAFRDGTPKTRPRSDSSAAALAVPLMTASGAVGVFSTEFRDSPEVDPERRALATIFAAQLTMLMGGGGGNQGNEEQSTKNEERGAQSETRNAV